MDMLKNAVEVMMLMVNASVKRQRHLAWLRSTASCRQVASTWFMLLNALPSSPPITPVHDTMLMTKVCVQWRPHQGIHQAISN